MIMQTAMCADYYTDYAAEAHQQNQSTRTKYTSGPHLLLLRHGKGPQQDMHPDSSILTQEQFGAASTH
jgi:hypothetical protein